MPADRSPPVPAAWLRAAAEVLVAPLVLLRADGLLLHANLAARRLLASGTLVAQRRDGRVGPADSRQRQAFDDALRHAVAGERSLLRLGLRAAAPTLVLSPLAPPPSEVVLVALPASEPADTEPYAQRHGLSAAEERVLALLVGGRRVSGIARALGLAAATVRSHLLAIRRKTGHAGIDELLQDFARQPGLLAPPGAAPGHGE
jgi:DNA-binding CsgD family transcriptional regulator